MKTDPVIYVFAAAGIAILAALQELTPAICGARVPFLLAGALYAAVRAEPARAAAAVLLSAFFADALASFPILCSPIFFFAAGLVARHLSRHSAIWATAVAAPLAEIWYAFWGLYTLDDPVLVRALAAAPLGALAAALLIRILPFLEHASGSDGPVRKEPS